MNGKAEQKHSADGGKRGGADAESLGGAAADAGRSHRGANARVARLRQAARRSDWQDRAG